MTVFLTFAAWVAAATIVVDEPLAEIPLLAATQPASKFGDAALQRDFDGEHVRGRESSGVDGGSQSLLPKPVQTGGGGDAPRTSLAPTSQPLVATTDLSPDRLARDVRIERLENGLTVYLSEDRTRPEVFGVVVVRTGARNDPTDNTGLAHYLEHMLFKGTTQLGTTDWAAERPHQQRLETLYDALAIATAAERPSIEAEIANTVAQTYPYVVPNELDKLLAEGGGVGINATTSEDDTTYYNSLAASQLPAWLELTAHRFADPVFRLFPSELEAVYEEKNLTLDRFEVQLFEHLVAQAFPNHPYGTRSIIGHVEHLARPSLAAMRDYFERYYVANNMALVLAGDFDADEVLAQVRKLFGGWRSGPMPPQRSGRVDTFAGEQRAHVRMTPVRVGAVAYRTLTPDHPDFVVLAVIREMLANDAQTGCLDRLVRDGELLLVYPYRQNYADTGLDMLFFVPRLVAQRFIGAERLVRSCAEQLGRGEFDASFMLAMRDRVWRQRRQDWEDNRKRALDIASAFVREPSWSHHLAAHDRLAELTPADVQRVAAHYFGENRLVLRSRIGRLDKQILDKPKMPAVTPVPGARSAYYRRAHAEPRAASRLRFVDPSTAVRRHDVAVGAVLAVNDDPYGDRFRLELRYGVGTDAVPALAIVAELLATGGTTEHAPDAWAHELTVAGLQLDVRAGLDRFVVRVEGPQSALADGVRVIDALVHAPRLQPARLRRLARERLATSKVLRRNPAHLADAVGEYLLYGEQSRFLRELGPRGVRRLRVDDLVAALRRAVDHELEIRYTGPTPDEIVLAEVRAGLRLSPAPRPAVAHVVSEHRLPVQPTVYLLPERGALQSHVRFAVAAGSVDRRERATADAFAEYFGGNMAGLVFQEIREYRALAYSAHASLRRDPTPQDHALLVASIGCQAHKTADAWRTMMDLLTAMPRHPDRIDSIRDMLVYGLETRSPDHAELQATLERWRRRGDIDDPRRSLVHDYQALTFADIERFYAEHVAGKTISVALVADPRKIDIAALVGNAELVELRQRDVFAR